MTDVILYFPHHQKMSAIMSCHQDIFPIILENVPVATLLAFTSTCKAFNAIKDTCMANNHIIKQYAEFDNGYHYLDVIGKSHIKLHDMSFIKKRDLNREKIDNTFKLFSFHCHEVSFGISMLQLQSYFMDMLHKEFGYTQTATCERMLIELYDTIKPHILAHCNINPYDFHQILYHVQARKYSRVSDLLKNIRFMKTTSYLYTLKILLDFINVSKSKKTRAIIIGVFYKYIDFIINDLLCNITNNSKFLDAIAMKMDEFLYGISNTKQFPKYLKLQLIDIIMDTTIKINILIKLAN